MPKRLALLAIAALLVSALLGLALATWLSWRVPLSPPNAQEPEVPRRSVTPVGDLPEPPQPLLDGGRGVPDRAVITAPPKPMAPVPGSQASQTVVPPNSAPSDLPTSPEPATPTGPAAPATPTAPGQPVIPNTAWLDALRSDLAACQAQGLLTRVVCQERARWRHCHPARAWGSVPECPGTPPSP
jgi:hypothetical protein